MSETLTEVRDESSTEETKVLDTPKNDPFKENSWSETIEQQNTIETNQQEVASKIIEEKKQSK